MEWIIFPIIWAFMVGGVVATNNKAEEKKPQVQKEISWDHGGDE